MGCKCGSQIILCNLPVRFDTYRGCSHGCRYCFAQKKNDISHIERDESVDGLRSFIEGKRGMTKIGGDFCYPLPRLRHDFEAIKAECHRYGLKFYSGENRLRAMGDSMTCCGIDGLPGFRPNEYNLCMLMNGKNPEPTEKMKEVGTGGPFKTLNQSAGSGRKIAKQSFYGLMQEELAKKTDYHRKVFGLDE